MTSHEPGAQELRDAVRQREASARELVTDALARARSHESLGAFTSLNAELALHEANVVDEQLAWQRRNGGPLLLLGGVPTAHKDLVEQRGHLTSRGSAAVDHVVADEDAPIVRDLRSSGAVSIGKTQVPEFGIAGYSENEIYPPARNPYAPMLTAGGSSGGTAAAVAAGIIPAAIASDAGGSIRIPSAACGLVGLKPGRGVVPADARNGLVDEIGMPRMGVSGPIARTARDAALLFDAIMQPGAAAGNDVQRNRDPEHYLRATERASELRGLRIGVSTVSPFASWLSIRFSDDAIAALDAAIATLAGQGHVIDEAHIDYGSRYPEMFTTVWTSSLARAEFTPEAEDRLGALARSFRRRAQATSAEVLRENVAALREFAKSVERQWGEYDAVLTPALASTPPSIGAFRELGPEGDYRLQCEWAPQTSVVNVVGVPAITAPTWLTTDGLPMGVQLIGRTGSEAMLLQLAQQLTVDGSHRLS